MSESNDTILMPCWAALFSEGQSADGSFAAMTMASALAWIAAWMDGSCAAAVSCVPLLTVTDPPSSFSAFLPPSSASTSYGFCVSLGMKYTFSPFLIAPLLAEPLAPAGAEFAAELPLELLLLVVELQAARMPPASTAVSAAQPTRRAVRIPVMVVPFLRWIEQGGRMDLPIGASVGPGYGSPPDSVAETTQRFAAVGHDDADEQQDTGDDVLLVGRDVHLGEGHLQVPHDRDGEDDADDRAAPAEDGDATEEHDGHDVQLEAGAGAVTHRRVLQGEQDAGERAEQAAEHEEPELDAIDPDAGELGRLRLQTDRHHRAAERRVVEYDSEHDRQDEEEDHRPGELAARHR